MIYFIQLNTFRSWQILFCTEIFMGNYYNHCHKNDLIGWWFYSKQLFKFCSLFPVPTLVHIFLILSWETVTWIVQLSSLIFVAKPQNFVQFFTIFSNYVDSNSMGLEILHDLSFCLSTKYCSNTCSKIYHSVGTHDVIHC